MSLAYQIPGLGATKVSPETSYPYASSIASSASSSSSSVFSADVPSQSSASSTSSQTYGWDSEDVWSANRYQAQAGASRINATAAHADNSSAASARCQAIACAQQILPPVRSLDAPVPAEQRQHPRRCSLTVNTHRAPPQLVRQSERKHNFVDGLVDSATQMVEVIWPTSEPPCRGEAAPSRGVLPLRTFIQETLRRSRTSYSTLQVALYYLVLIKAHVPKRDFTMEQSSDCQSYRALQCGRRMFLAALILASKYLQDRNYSARAWSKISGLQVKEINTNEMAFLQAVNWKLHIADQTWERWQDTVLKCTPTCQGPSSPGSPAAATATRDWKSVVPFLTPELDTMDVSTPKAALQPSRPQTSMAVRSPLPLGDVPSQPSTPTQYSPPRFLEPRPDMLPPTPSLARMGPLPTPQLTPQTAVANTPAAGMATLPSRRPSMCAAMAQAQLACMSRCTVDQWGAAPKPFGLSAYQFSRRGSGATAPSTSSSPESMISDNSSRSSRASSISSISSGASWAPNYAKLARLATCRNARMNCPVTQEKQSAQDVLNFDFTSSPMSSPNMDAMSITDTSPTRVPLRSTPSVPVLRRSENNVEVSPKGRKRGRSSVDMSLVKDMLDNSGSQRSRQTAGHQTVLPDRSIAQSFLLGSYAEQRTPTCLTAKALQSPSQRALERRVPVQKDHGGRKRACCASENKASAVPSQGPGMWAGVL